MNNPYGSIPYSTLSIGQLQAVADTQDNELAQELLTRLDAVQAELTEWPDEDEIYCEGSRETARSYQHSIRRTLRKDLELSEDKIEEILDSIERKI